MLHICISTYCIVRFDYNALYTVEMFDKPSIKQYLFPTQSNYSGQALEITTTVILPINALAD